MNRRFLVAGSIMAAMLASSGAGAADRRQVTESSISAHHSVEDAATETIVVEILSDRGPLWSGTLRIGGKYGNASFSQSTTEFAAPCPGRATDSGASKSGNHQLRFNIGRRNWQQTPDSFNINVNWVRPLSLCEGEGTNTVGFTRVIELPRGKTVKLEGTEGLMVRLTRAF